MQSRRVSYNNLCKYLPAGQGKQVYAPVSVIPQCVPTTHLPNAREVQTDFWK